MRILNAMVCAAVVGLSTLTSACAEELGTHPEIGKTKPREFLNSDLLKLPKREQQAWIHGAMTQMVQAISDHENAKCVMDWYFDVGNGAEYIPRVIEHYRDAPVAATLMAAARKACPLN